MPDPLPTGSFTASRRQIAPSTAFPLLAAALAAVLCVFVNRHTFSFDFVPIDDDLRIVFNAHLGWPSPERLEWIFLTTGYNGYYMPLGWIPFSLISAVSGLHPEPYHAVLVGFHALNAVLLFVLIRRLVPAVVPRLVTESGASWTDACALLGSLWWSLNPLRVESTAWISGLSYAQAIAFAFASVIVHLGPGPRSARTEALRASSRGWRRPMAATSLYACSLLTYPIALGLAPVFFVIDWFAGRRPAPSSIPGTDQDGAPERSGVSFPSRKAGFVVVAAVVLAVTLQAARKTDEHFHIVENHLPLSVRAGRAAYALSYYFAKPWVPLGLTRAYPATLARQGSAPGTLLRPFWSTRILEGVAATILLTVLCVASARLRRTAGPFFLCHLFLLAPVIGITFNGDYITFDRYCALACAAWAVAVAILILKAKGRFRTVVATVFCAYLLLLACLSERQTAMWRDASSLWSNISSHLESGDFPDLQYVARAYVLEMSGQYDQAAAVASRGLAAVPSDASLLALQRDIAGCRIQYARFCPFAEVHVALAGVYLKAGDRHEADEHLRVALELSPGYSEAAYNRALVRLDLGEYRGALHDFLWAKAHSPAPFSPSQCRAILDRVGNEARAADDLGLARAALAP